jgi:hypothetical protein
MCVVIAHEPVVTSRRRDDSLLNGHQPRKRQLGGPLMPP